MARRAGQPTVRSRLLAILLRKFRITAGLSNAAVAKSTGMSPSVISSVETAKSGIYLDKLQKLLDLYQVSESQRAQLIDMARHAEERGWVNLHSDTLPENWQTWAEFEAEAVAVFNYEPLMIPGLLQTPEYARAVIQATGPALSVAEVDKLVASRMARQVHLNKSQPLKLRVIIEGDVLKRPFGGADAWVRQLRHLVDCAAYPNIQIQILPTAAGVHPALDGSFVILEYGDGTKLVHIECKIPIVYLDEEEQIQEYTQIWNRVSALACNMEKSVDLISAIADQVDGKT
jgi:transcriptional regulator with XRE-family HTH domain